MYGTEIDHIKCYKDAGALRFSNLKGEDRNNLRNQNGEKSVGIYLYPEDAERLAQMGWNVKEWIPVDGSDPRPYLKVIFKWTDMYGKPVREAPTVRKVKTKDGTVTCKPIPLDEVTVGEIDDDRFAVIDGHFKINPSFKNGVVAYAEVGYFVVDESTPKANRRDLEKDPFAKLYDQIV